MSRHTNSRSISADVAELACAVQAALMELAKRGDDVCFVVGRFGVRWASADAPVPSMVRLCGDPALSAAEFFVPRWDAKHRILTVAGRIVKRFQRSSPNQEMILAAFEAERWPRRIEDPLPARGDTLPKVRLHDTIRWLNLKQESRLISFSGDGTGCGICWKLAEEGSRSPAHENFSSLHSRSIDRLARPR